MLLMLLVVRVLVLKHPQGMPYTNTTPLAGEIASFDYRYIFLLFVSLVDCYLICLADVIFLIYVYQRWIYPVDKKRVNEFGFGGEEEDESSSNTAVTAQTEEEKKTN